MPQSEAQKRASKKYYERNKQKVYERNKKWKDENKERCAAVKKKWYEDNKEDQAKKKKEYNQSHKKENLERVRKYRQTDGGKKSMRIINWKCRGMIHDDFDALYDRYITTTHCDICNKKFKNDKDRHCDHDHETGAFRQILCGSCNNQDYWKKIIST